MLSTRLFSTLPPAICLAGRPGFYENSLFLQRVRRVVPVQRVPRAPADAEDDPAVAQPGEEQLVVVDAQQREHAAAAEEEILMMQVGAAGPAETDAARRGSDLAEELGFFLAVGRVDLLEDLAHVIWDVFGVFEEHVGESIE